MYEPFETFDVGDYLVELHQDEEPMSPADWDNYGTLVGFGRPLTDYTFTEAASSDAEDARDRGILVRYLRLTRGEIALPVQFQDYGSGGARMYDAEEDDCNGYIYTTHEQVSKLCGEDPSYHSLEWITEALRGEVRTWDAYVAGEVVGYVVRHSETGEVLDSCWGFYPDERPDPLAYVRGEARAAAESLNESDQEAPRYLAL